MKASLSTGFGNIWPNICSCSDFFRSSPLLSDSEKFPLNCSSQTNIVSDVPKDMAMSPLCIRKPANELQISSIYHFMMFTSCFPKKTAVIKGCMIIYLGLSPVNAITLQVSRNPYLSVIYLDIGPMSVCDGTGEPSLILRSSPHACNRQFYNKW